MMERGLVVGREVGGGRGARGATRRVACPGRRKRYWCVRKWHFGPTFRPRFFQPRFSSCAQEVPVGGRTYRSSGEWRAQGGCALDRPFDRGFRTEVLGRRARGATQASGVPRVCGRRVVGVCRARGGCTLDRPLDRGFPTEVFGRGASGVRRWTDVPPVRRVACPGFAGEGWVVGRSSQGKVGFLFFRTCHLTIH